MKIRKIPLMLMAASLIFPPVFIKAEEVSIPSNMTVAPNQVCNAMLKVPANLNLTFDADAGIFKNISNIAVYGNITNGTIVNVTVPKELTYSDGDVLQINGNVIFGSSFDSATNINSWTDSECKAGVNEDGSLKEDTLVNKKLSIVVLSKNIKTPKSYNTNVTFNYSTDVLGMYRSIVNGNVGNMVQVDAAYVVSDTLGTTSSSLTTASIRGIYFKAYDNNIENAQNINLNDTLPETSTNKFPQLFAGVIYGAWNSSSRGGFYNSSNSLPNLKTVELTKNLYYLSDVKSTSARTSIISCFYQYSGDCYSNTITRKCPNISTVIIPADMTSDNFRRYTVDGSTTNIYNSTEVIGNATMFIKNVNNETNKFIYVPNIVYRGTKGQWKALSGTDDWVFGNKDDGTYVIVYCTDGEIIY